MTNDSDKTTHFGFETVAESDKAGRVQGVFNSVASKYDIMNDVMSVGIHRVWKEAMMDWLAPRAGQARGLLRARDGVLRHAVLATRPMRSRTPGGVVADSGVPGDGATDGPEGDRSASSARGVQLERHGVRQTT